MAAAATVTVATVAVGIGLYRLMPPEVQLVLHSALTIYGFVYAVMVCIRTLNWLVNRLGAVNSTRRDHQ